MKNIVKTLVLVLVCTILSANVHAAEQGFSYLTESSTLMTNYKIEMPQSPFASLVVLPYGMKRTAFSEETADSSKTMFKMCYTASGTVAEEIQFTDSFNSGAYVLYIECGTDTDKNAFIIPSPKLVGVVSSVNSGTALTSSDFGADNSIFANYKTDINLLIRNARPNGGYTNQTFLDTYMASEGLARFKHSDLTLDEFVDLYDSYFGNTFDSYDEWSDEKKEKYSSVLMRYGIGSISAAKLANNSVFVSECHMTSDTYALQTLAVNYFKEQGMKLDTYKSLNSYNQYNVFAKVFENIKNLWTVSDIYNKFITVSESLLSEEAPVYKPPGGGGGGGGGGGITSPNIPVITPNPSSLGETSLSTPIPDISTSDVSVSDGEKSIFTDIQQHWAKEYIVKCHQHGLVNGFGDNTFRPDKSLTRAELTALITNLLKLDTVAESVFIDVSRDDWYYNSILKAYSAGIVSGYGDSFMPETNVSRQDMAVMIARSFDYSGIDLDGEKVFDDSNLISDYASESVAVLGANEIITGDNNCFRPQDTLTRAEAATIICRASDYLMGGRK